MSNELFETNEDIIYNELKEYEIIDKIKDILKEKYITNEEITNAIMCFKTESILPNCFKRLNIPNEDIKRYALIYLSKQLTKQQKQILDSRNMS